MSKAFLVSMVVLTLAAFGVASYVVTQNAINIESEANRMYSISPNQPTAKKAENKEVPKNGNTNPVNEEGGEIDMCLTMSYDDAARIAVAGGCGQDAKLKETHFCNEGTKTWWIDLDQENSGCNPACVINTETGQAEINWRCTGAIITPAAVQ